MDGFEQSQSGNELSVNRMCPSKESTDREHVQVVYTAVPTMSLKRCNSRVKRLAQLFIEYNHLF